MIQSKKNKENITKVVLSSFCCHAFYIVSNGVSRYKDPKYKTNLNTCVERQFLTIEELAL